MKPVSALRRVVANSDRVNALAADVARLRQTTDDLAADIAGRLDRLQEAADNQSGDSNRRLDQLVDAAESVNKKLDRLQEAADNQSGNSNRRLDQLIEATSSVDRRLDRLQQAADNLSRDANRRLDRLVEVLADLSANANEKLIGLIQTIVKSSAHEARPAFQEPEIRSIEAATGAPWLDTESPAPLPPPRWSADRLAKDGVASRALAPTNSLRRYQPLLNAIEPWRGPVPKGYLVDFLGVLTDANFLASFGIEPTLIGGMTATTEMPPLAGFNGALRFETPGGKISKEGQLAGANGEWWFETVNWFEAAREARDRFVMITLGACYGAQAVGAQRALEIVNPMPAKLVAVEPVPENYQWIRKHFRDNGINPDDHWLVGSAISDVNQPVLFPVGAAGSGANNCIATDTVGERKILADQVIASGKSDETLRNLIVNNTTGIVKRLQPDKDLAGEIKLVSAVTLRDLLSPFDRVDYLEADIQQSEARVFPPFVDMLRKKVRRIHIGTHGVETHHELHRMFAENGWEIVFSYPPNGTYESELGPFELNDGVLTVRNPDL